MSVCDIVQSLILEEKEKSAGKNRRAGQDYIETYSVGQIGH